MQSENSLRERLLNGAEDSASMQEVVALESVSEAERNAVPEEPANTRELKIRNSKCFF